MIDEPQQFIDQVGLLRKRRAKTNNSALAHVLEVHAHLETASTNIADKLYKMPRMPVKFPKHIFGQQLQHIAQMIIAGVDVPIYKLGLEGFDTHTNQRVQHSSALLQLAEGLAAFSHAMKMVGQWNQVAVMTYSEFGRRVKENGAKGTDHGSASVQLVAGGKINGGLYGRQPDLEDLHQGNLKHTTDFRSVYATLSKKWLGQAHQPWGNYPLVNFI